MQEIKKRRIVIASVLKPVDDVRMFEKIAVSLARTYDVHVIGFDGASNDSSTQADAVWFHSLGRFNRLSMKRLFAPWKVFTLSYQIKPEVMIVTTHELLCVALLLKILTRCKIIYDIQENYARNIYYGESVPPLLRLPLAAYVRIKEWLLSIFVSHFFLSEKNYVRELGFIRSRYTVLENKLNTIPLAISRPEISSQKKITLLFSGTLANTTGVFTAIQLTSVLNREDPRIHLCIIGYASQEHIRAKIIDEVKDKPFIEVIGLDHLVGHRRILDKVRACDLGIIAYPPNASTHTAFPTKLFEYLGNQLPILLVDNKEWSAYCKTYDAAIVFDIDVLDPKQLLKQILTTRFYTSFPSEVFWHSEKRMLKKVVENLFTAKTQRR